MMGWHILAFMWPNVPISLDHIACKLICVFCGREVGMIGRVLCGLETFNCPYRCGFVADVKSVIQTSSLG